MTQQIPSLEPSERKPFIIGLTLAGAVSAGAYSAGVLDFLFEALNEWQAAKDRRDPGTPMHDVQIAAVSGASAGGITAAISLLSLAGGIRRGEEDPWQIGDAPPGAERVRRITRVLPELYDAWVMGPRLFGAFAKAKNGAFLDPTDLKGNASFASLLDSDPLQQVAERVVSGIKPSGTKYKFLTDPVHLFLTVTNLDGIPYVLRFENGQHAMTNHADCVHYAMSGLGASPFPIERCQWLDSWEDNGTLLDTTQPLDPKSEAGHAFIQSVLATSAFPFALRSRELIRSSFVFKQRAWFIENTDKRPTQIYPAWQPGPDNAREFMTYCVAVDGGATDNQPFEYAHWAIRDMYAPRNARSSTESDRAVIMIDPFGASQPYNVREISSSRNDDLVLTHVLKTFVPALTNQARFKITDLMHASAEEVYSRYLIAPARYEQKKRAAPSLASGLLEAFGGFLDQRFREHDFQLGRRNCQKFLKTYFVLHKDNPIFCPDGWRALPESADPDQNSDLNMRRIIPCVGTAFAPLPAAPWPTIEPQRLHDFQEALGTRVDRLVYKLINDNLSGVLANVAARFIWRHIKRDSILQYLRAVVETSLLRNGQLLVVGGDGKYMAPTKSQFAVLSALTDPAWEMRTAAGIAEEYASLPESPLVDGQGKPLDATAVESVIGSLETLVVRHSRGHGTPAGYTLRHRQPSLGSVLTRWLRIGRKFSYDDERKREPKQETGAAWPAVP